MTYDISTQSAQVPSSEESYGLSIHQKKKKHAYAEWYHLAYLNNANWHHIHGLWSFHLNWMCFSNLFLHFPFDLLKLSVYFEKLIACNLCLLSQVENDHKENYNYLF